ncbi:hypothetical protein [Mesobacillus sp. S13]|uniref:hypothetical protein n=1 Tax=Mesobacillus sp. S13 TaxID=2880221 RepID=UPI001CF43A7C|nr:hypothetical protein [Mesobacillus sp. S13]
MKETKIKDVTYVETIETVDFIVEVFVSNIPRSEHEINRSMERLAESRYRLQEKNDVRFRNKN